MPPAGQPGQYGPPPAPQPPAPQAPAPQYQPQAPASGQPGQQGWPTPPAAQPGGWAGAPTPGAAQPGGWPPAAYPGAGAAGPGHLPPSSGGGGRGKIIGLVAGGLALALVAGLLMMFLGQRSKPEPDPTVSRPTTTGRPATPTTKPTSPNQPTQPTAPSGSGTTVDLGGGVSATYPAGWTQSTSASTSATSKTYLSPSRLMVVQVISGKSAKSSLDICTELIEETKGQLANAKTNPCKVDDTGNAGTAKVEVSYGAAGGTLAGQQGSTQLADYVLVGRRADGLLGIASIRYNPSKKPSDAELKQAIEVFDSLVTSLEKAP